MLDVVKAVQTSKKNFGVANEHLLDKRLLELTSIISHLKDNAKSLIELEALLFGTSTADLQSHEYEPFFKNTPVMLESFAAELKAQGGGDPAGVVMMILPRTQSFCAWMSTALRELLIGNVLIVKPSRHQRELWSAVRDIFASINGNVIFLLGDFESYGAFLTEHPGVDAIHIGASLETAQVVIGKSVLLKKLVRIESSAVNSALVLKESDVKAAAVAIAKNLRHRFGLSNRRLTKVFVVDSVLAEFKAELFLQLKQMDWSVAPRLGLQDFKAVQDKLTAEKGKNLFIGSSVNAPWVLEDFSDCSELQQQELLLPILMIRPVKYPADAAKWSNAQPYGRAVSIFADDPERVRKLAAKFNCGLVLANACEPVWSPTAFSALRGASGWGHLSDFNNPKVFSTY